jgi:hypothetical protein
MSNDKTCIGMFVAGAAWLLTMCGNDAITHPDDYDTICWRMTAFPFNAFISVFQPDQPNVVGWPLWIGVLFFYFILLLILVLLVMALPGMIRALASRFRWHKRTNKVR